MTEYNKDYIAYLRKKEGDETIDAYLRTCEMRKRGEKSKEIPKCVVEEIDRCLAAMEKYGDNHWWKSDNKELVACYQYFEDVFIINHWDFIDYFESLIGRKFRFGDYESDSVREKVTRIFEELKNK